MRIMKKAILCIFLLFNMLIIKSQERFIKKANDLLHEGDYASSREMIKRFQDKEPLQPIGMYMLAKWYSRPMNPLYNPDSAFNMLEYANTLLANGKGTKVEKDNVFEEYEKLHTQIYLTFRDTLSMMTFEFIDKQNSIEKYDYYNEKYKQFPYAQLAKKKAEHLRYIEVKTKDEYLGYFQFIQKYPDAEDAPLAEKRIYELEYYKYAISKNTQSIKNYISKYPNSHLIDSAWREIHRIEYVKLLNSNSVADLEKYLIEYPQSQYIKKVEDLLYVVAFNLAKSANSSTSLQSYQLKYPNSPYNKVAFDLEVRFAWEETSANPSLISIRKYINRYPESPYLGRAKELESFYYFSSIEETENVDVFIQFIEDYPGSKEITKAKAKITELYIDETNRLIKEESWEEALSAAEKILEYDSQNANGYYLTGFVFHSLQNHEKAIENLNTAIQLSPSNPEFISLRGLSYLSTDQMANAFSDFNQSISKDPNNGIASFGLGVIYEQRAAYPQAIAYFRKALAAGFEIQERIDYLEEIEREKKNNSVNYPSRSSSSNVQKPTKKLVLPKQTLQKLKTIKK